MTLPSKIYKLESFGRQLKTILIESCADTFKNLKVHDEVATVDWNNVLSCASILSVSDNYEHQAAALKIAQHCLESPETTESQKIGSAVILDNLTNRPAIKLAVDRQHLNGDYADKIPLPLAFDISRRKIQHTILTETREIYLNKFQKEAYETFRSSNVVSVSAPTSAGKSFVLYQTLIQIIEESSQNLNIVYIVPTRALISQVERDFRSLIQEEKLNNVFITSVPKLEREELTKNKVFVFTQERLHWFKIENPDFIFDYIIVDEAQKISEGNRGILLQEKIEEVIETMPGIKVFYSSPLTSNPEILYRDLTDTVSKASVKTEFVAVNQNLIYVTQVPKNTKQFSLELCLPQEKLPLGTIELQNRPIGEFKKVAFISHLLSEGDGGNIIYMNKAAYAEKLANVLYDVVDDDVSDVKEIRELVDFCKKTVHRDFLLAKVLNRRIAFHYGNMPVLIREEIERLFNTGLIKYLICTSTLLEGVNLPAKNIFLRKPTRGTGNPLNDSDFWNLAGRAGRLGKEFQGNIICIDPYSWNSLPSPGRKKQEIKKSIDQITDNIDELIGYIRDGSPRKLSREKPELEYALTYFYSKFLKGKIEVSEDESLAKLNNELQLLSETIELPNEIIFRNPGISPIAQQNLLNHFREKQELIERYIPDLPEAEDAVKDSYTTIIGMISRFFSGDTELLNYYYAILVVNWMRGYPLSLLIKSNFEYAQRKESKKKIDAVIRDTMKDVEEYARFKFAKYSACYVDILRHHLNQEGRTDLASRIPDLHIWLEFGVSQTTQVSLISLGLTRQSAIALSEFISRDDLSKAEAKEWILMNDLQSLQLSQIVINDITRVLAIAPTNK